MTEPRMPTTLPSPVDRDEFRFVAVDAAGETWQWSEEELVWVRDGPAREQHDADAPVVGIDPAIPAEQERDQAVQFVVADRARA